MLKMYLTDFQQHLTAVQCVHNACILQFTGRSLAREYQIYGQHKFKDVDSSDGPGRRLRVPIPINNIFTSSPNKIDFANLGCLPPERARSHTPESAARLLSHSKFMRGASFRKDLITCQLRPGFIRRSFCK